MKEWKKEAIRLANTGMSWRQIAKELGVARSTVSDTLRKEFKGYVKPSELKAPTEVYKPSHDMPKVSVMDIETSSMLLGGWGLYNQNYSIAQIEKDWDLLGYSAKWYGEDEVMYSDISDKTEEEILYELWELLNSSDIVIGHNIRRFDVPKIRTRMIVNGFKPFSPVRFIDTLDIAKREFGFTSNKLEYLTNLLCKKYVKSGHENFSGYSLWSEFLKGNPEAISEMREYCQLDTQSVEELYDILAPWSKSLPVFEIYDDDEVDMSVWEEDGYHRSNLGKYQRYRHKHTGQWRRGRVNLLSKERRKQLLANII